MFTGDSDNEDRTRARELEIAQGERKEYLKLKEELKARGIDLDEPEEDLACPSCGRIYTYGSTCLDCGEPLVGLSSVEIIRGAPKPSRDWGPAIGVTVGLLVAVLGLLFWLLVGR